MMNLIRAELYKLQRNKTFWVLISTVTGLSTLLHFLILIDWWLLSGTTFDQAGLSELNALSVLMLPLIFNLIVSSLAGFNISIEFSHGSVIKNQIISGNKRIHIFLAKYLIFSLGAVIITILIPVLTGLILLILFGHAELLNASTLFYLGRAFGLFTLQFMSFTAIVLWISIFTGDSGKTILFTLLLVIAAFIIEKFVTTPVIRILYEHTFYYQLSEVFNATMTSGEILNSVFIGIVSLVIMILCGIFMFKRKEIK